MKHCKSPILIIYFCCIISVISVLSPIATFLNQLNESSTTTSEILEQEDNMEDINPVMFRSNPQHTGVYITDQLPLSYETLWSVKKENGAFFNPTVYNGVVYAEGEDSSIFGFDIETGKEIWRYRTDDLQYTMTGPAISEGQIFFSSVRKQVNQETFAYEYESALYSVDIQTKQENWTIEIPGEIVSGLTIDSEKVYVTSVLSTPSKTLITYIYALDIYTGKEIWSFSPTVLTSSSRNVAACLVSLFSFHTGGHLGGMVTIGDGTAYWSNLDQYLYALDSETGNLKWDSYINLCSNPIPVFSDNIVFVNHPSKLLAFNSENGDKLWEFDILIDKESVVGMSRMTSPAVYDGNVFIGTNDEHLYILDSKSGKVEWKLKTMGRVESLPSIAEGIVVFGTNLSIDHTQDTGYLYAVDIRTRKELWKMKVAPYGSNGSPVITDEFIVFNANDGALHALKLGD